MGLSSISAVGSVTPAEGRLPIILGYQRISESTERDMLFIDRGRGIHVYDSGGREYIEASSSFYVASLGFQNEELIEAIERQYRELPFYASGIGRMPHVSLEAAERLAEIVPVRDAHILFGSTGSEANEFLIKILRFAAIMRGQPRRRTIISRHGSYHGGTLAAASMTGSHHAEFGLPLDGFKHVSQPDYRGGRLPGETGAEFAARLGAELERLIAAEPAGSIAAFFAEPVSCSAGFVVPPAEYWPTISRILKAHDIDLVADEVITGMGRTGNLFGSETLGIAPDHVTLAKGVTSGYFPVSAAAIGTELYEALDKGTDKYGTFGHAATYAAHPVGAAAVIKTIEIIRRDGLAENARRMGARLAQGLRAFEGHPLVGAIDSLGLGAAVDCLRRGADDQIIGDDAPAVADALYRALFDHGVIARQAGRSVLFVPPLIIDADQIDEICGRFGAALDQVAASGRFRI